MERDSQENSATNVRRRRRIGRSIREKTPDPTFRRLSSEEDSSVMGGTTPSEDTQVITMQIRPPRSTMSAHESKILRRRDKTFATTAARSHSQPREAERLSEPEATELIQTLKRSLSMPRNKEMAESSEGEVLNRDRTLSPEARLVSMPIQQPVSHEKLSRLEQNLRRFEDERKRFESEKRLFEKEKREHKLKYKQMMDNEERKLLLQSYRKLSDRIKLPQGQEERKRLIHSLRLERQDVNLPTNSKTAAFRNRHSGGYDESSTQFSSSDAETAEEILQAKRLAKQLSPVRRHNSAMASASVRGPPPQPPARKSVSRNNSLSPIRSTLSRNNSLSPVKPQRRSKTPEQRSEIVRKLSEREDRKSELKTRLETTTTTEFESEKESQLRQRKVRRSESLHRPEPKRRESLEISQDKVDSSAITIPITKETKPEIIIKPPEEVQQSTVVLVTTEKPTFFQRFKQLFKKSKPKDEQKTTEQQELLATQKSEQPQIPDTNILSKAFLKAFFSDCRQQWQQMTSDYPQEIKDIKKLRNKCFAHTIMLILLIGFGGLMFRYTEGSSENIYKCEVRKVKRDFIDNLWDRSHNMREEDWKTLARQKLRKFEEELHAMGELGIRYFPGQKSWNFVNCILYCWTVITTIGYGHITPKTTLGRSLTIAYAIIGIPMFLILLADFGKLFTRVIKFVWGYVRRLYYTGTCRRIRKQQQVRDAMTGFSNVYDIAIRRPSQFFGMGPDADIESQASEAGKSMGQSMGQSHPETPTSPYPETLIVDDEFNLPISLASVLLIGYILVGTFVYTLWEKDWSYFEAFYFVFISMSTIGFGDLVPNHPIFMMCSIIYLVFGLALTSMFINVVQIKLSDTFKGASAKIGATLGVELASELGEDGSQLKTPSDLASVHGSRLGKIAEDDDEEITSASVSPRPLTSILRPSRPNSPTSQDELAASDFENGPPPLLPRRQVSVEQAQAQADAKKKKRRFF